MRMSVIDATGLVVNVVEAEAGFDPGPGLTATDVYAEIGDHIIAGVRVPAPPPPYKMTEAVLYEAISDVCPINSVTVGNGTDRSTWSYDPKPEATAQQKADADHVIATIPLAPPKTLAVSEFISRFTNAEYRAATATTWRQTGGNAKNWDVVVFDNPIKLSKKKATTLKTSLVTDGILTQARADEIFS